MTDQPFQFLDPSLVLLDGGLLGEDLRPFLDGLPLPMREGDRMNAARAGNLADGLGPAQDFHDYLELEPRRVPLAVLL